MRKHIKREDSAPRAGKTITLVTTRIVDAKNTPAANDTPKHGKLNYQGKAKPAKAQPKHDRRIERTVITQGRYFGSSEQVCAFVMLDEDTAPKGDAANDPKVR